MANRIMIPLMLVCFLAPQLESSQQAREKPDLPKELRETYDALVKSFESGKKEAIEPFILRYAIVITTGHRPKKREEYGPMNTPFLKSHFLKDIQAFRKEKDGTYLVRTGTSYLRFVETKNYGWKLYDYGDKPIE